MTHVELIAHIASLSGAHKTTVAKVLEHLTETLATTSDVRLGRLGTFKHVTRAARKGRNPRTGDPVTIPAKVTVAFKPAAGLKAALNA